MALIVLMVPDIYGLAGFRKFSIEKGVMTSE